MDIQESSQRESSQRAQGGAQLRRHGGPGKSPCAPPGGRLQGELTTLAPMNLPMGPDTLTLWK